MSLEIKWPVLMNSKGWLGRTKPRIPTKIMGARKEGIAQPPLTDVSTHVHMCIIDTHPLTIVIRYHRYVQHMRRLQEDTVDTKTV